MMMPTAMAASRIAATLARPSRLDRTAGRPKMPLPMMQFTVSAAMLQRPMARTKPSLEVVSGPVSGIASLYHKRPARWQFMGLVS